MTREPIHHSAADMAYPAASEKLFEGTAEPLFQRIEAFARFASRQSIAKFLARYEIFKRILHVNGSIVECGVLFGQGLFTFAKLSAIYEPTNHTRKIVGFDTFLGFPSVSVKDRDGSASTILKEGEFAGSSLKALEHAAALYDANRTLAHVPKIELVRGDVSKTAPQYIKENPQLVVSLLYLDLDLYEPTKAAIECFLPRVPKGGIVVFDELNAKNCPGETVAAMEAIGVSRMRLERFPTETFMSYWVVE